MVPDFFTPLNIEVRGTKPYKKIISVLYDNEYKEEMFTPCLCRILTMKDVLHRPSLGQLVDELVEVSDLSHRWIFDGLNTDIIHTSGYQEPQWIFLRAFVNKCFEVLLLF